MVVIGFVGTENPWLWLILLTMPIFAWFLEQEQRDLQRLISLVLDDVAKVKGFSKIKFPLPDTMVLDGKEASA